MCAKLAGPPSYTYMVRQMIRRADNVLMAVPMPVAAYARRWYPTSNFAPDPNSQL